MWTAWILLVTVTIPVTVPAVPSYRMCGAHLADLMSLVCQGRGYNDPFSNSRHKRNVGIVDECCKKQCSYRVLQQYCAQPPSTSSSTENGNNNNNNNNISDSSNDARQLQTAGSERLRRLQAQVRGQGHRPRPNRCSCRKQRKGTVVCLVFFCVIAWRFLFQRH